MYCKKLYYDFHDISVTYTKVLGGNSYSLNSGVSSPIAKGVAYKIKHLAMQSQSTFTDIWGKWVTLNSSMNLSTFAAGQFVKFLPF